MSKSPSFRAQWARRLVRSKLSKQVNHHGGNDFLHGGMPGQTPLASTPLQLPQNFDLPEVNFDKGTKVCIIGAGAAGLYIAMILDDLAIPNLSYDILEADDRVGGRMKTHYFSDAKHDYYDIGAMRFPQIPIMDRTFDLFKKDWGARHSILSGQQYWSIELSKFLQRPIIGAQAGAMGPIRRCRVKWGLNSGRCRQGRDHNLGSGVQSV